MRRPPSGARSSQDHPPPDRRSVGGSVYDRQRENAPPLGVVDVSSEPMDPAGVELLARDLLELLEWAEEGRRAAP